MRALQSFRIPVLLLSAVLAFAPALGAQDTGTVQYYVSNDLGMALERIGWYRQEEFPYILLVMTEGGRETRTLLYQGLEVQRWEFEEGEQRIYRDSQLEQRRRYDIGNRLIEDQLYAEGSLTQRTLYHYNRDLLERTETFGADGRLLYRDFYSLSPDGQLRGVTREDGRGDQRFALADGAKSVAEERYGNSRERRINRYDQEGRLAEREYWYDGQLLERERFEYRDDGEKLSSSRLEELSLERVTLRSYDDEGRIIRVEVTEGERQIQQTVHVRDGQGRIVETTTRGPRGIENWLFEYDEQELVREEYRIRGFLERITLYSRQGQERIRVEELYREGQVFMRVHYRSEQKIREEFLRNGEVVRVREFE
jgi:hypothetical protein